MKILIICIAMAISVIYVSKGFCQRLTGEDWGILTKEEKLMYLQGYADAMNLAIDLPEVTKLDFSDMTFRKLIAQINYYYDIRGDRSKDSISLAIIETFKINEALKENELILPPKANLGREDHSRNEGEILTPWFGGPETAGPNLNPLASDDFQNPQPLQANPEGLLGPTRSNAYGPGLNSDATGRPFYWEPKHGGSGRPDPTLRIKPNAYGPGIGMDQYGRPVRPKKWP